MVNQQLYEKDFYAWTMSNAKLLHARQFDQLDIENLVEEIETMGRSEKRELTNRLCVLIAHLLKWEFQPNFRSRSWESTLKEQRRSLIDLLAENPSLRSKIQQDLQRTYEHAVLLAVRETGLSEEIFPEHSPYTFQQLLDERFFPDNEVL